MAKKIDGGAQLRYRIEDTAGGVGYLKHRGDCPTHGLGKIDCCCKEWSPSWNAIKSKCSKGQPQEGVVVVQLSEKLVLRLDPRLSPQFTRRCLAHLSSPLEKRLNQMMGY